MENIIFICKFCGQERKNGNSLRNHERLCKENPNRQRIEEYTHTEKWRNACKSRIGCSFQNIQTFTCAFCNKTWDTTKSGFKNHELHCDSNPNRRPGFYKGRKRTTEEKRKISESMKKVYKGKSIWNTQIEKRKSFAEQYFDTCFPNLKQNYHVDRYFLDLANPEKKLYIEVDGEQHYNDQRIVEHDKIRTARLEELGWKCLRRIRWSEYKKLSKEEQESLITELQKQI